MESSTLHSREKFLIKQKEKLEEEKRRIGQDDNQMPESRRRMRDGFENEALRSPNVPPEVQARVRNNYLQDRHSQLQTND
jgi:hypothetical protein